MRWNGIALGLLCLGVAHAAGAAPGWTLEKLALTAEAAPGTSETYTSFDNSRDGGATAAFVAELTGGVFSLGTFQLQGGGVVPLAVPGDPAPGTGGGSYSIVFSPPAVGPSHVAFASTLSGGTATHGLFRASEGDVVALMLFGDTAPGGGSFEPGVGDLVLLSVNGGGDVAFRSTLSGGGLGFFLAPSAGGFTELVKVGDTLAGVGTWTGLGTITLNDQGEAAFTGDVNAGGGGVNGLFLHDGGIATLALAGDPAPGTGETFTDFFYPYVNGASEVAFIGLTTGPPGSGGLFLATAAGIVPILLEDDVLPGSGGATPTAFGPGYPTLNDRGSLAFSVGFAAGSGGVYLYDGTRDEIRPVVLSGEEAPDAGGATFTGFEYTGLDDEDNVSFEGILSDGRSGVFVASAASAAAVPSLATGGQAALLLLLTGVGILRLRS